MNVTELFSAFRRDIKDTVKPYLVSDDSAFLYLNEAQTEAARRAHLLVSSTGPTSTASVSAGESIVDIDPRIIAIRRIRLASQSNQLRMSRVREMDSFNPGWDASSSQSTPSFAILDYETDKIYLYPTPAIADDLQMTVVREPVKALTSEDDAPEIAPRWHLSLIEWMKFRAYINEDSELFDAKAADRALGLFEQEFGPKRSASDEAFEYAEYHDIGEL